MKYLVGVMVLMVAGIVAFAVYRWQGNRFAPAPDDSPADQDPRLTYDTPLRSVRPDVHYVGDEACASCHLDKAETYRRHPMGRSLAPIAQVASRQNYDKEAGNPFEALGFQFLVERRGDQVVHKERTRDAAGKLITETAASVQFAIGSGTHAYSYLIQRDGVLYQSPVTWFSQKKTWDLSPSFAGYYLRFERPILPGCLFCHCNHAEPVPDTLNSYRQPIFEGHAIGCERCHGPGQLHVQQQERGAATGNEQTIVHPGRLSPPLRDAVCEQCHLGGAMRVLRRGREAFDYRPGLPLELFWTIFVKPVDGAQESRVAGHVEQMHASRCFQMSAGNMSCTSCHDPHLLPAAAEKEPYYRQRCLKCHADKPCSEPLANRKKISPTDDCVACHMPQTGSDITHVALTDHRIPRRRDVTSNAREAGNPAPVQDALVEFHRRRLDEGDRELMRDLGVALMENARVRPDSNRAESSQRVLPVLEQAVERHPNDLPARDSLALALGFRGFAQKALATCKDTLDLAPRREVTLSDAAMISQALGKNEESLGYWQKALAINPWSSRYRFEVAQQLALKGDWAAAAVNCQRVLQNNATHIDCRILLVECFLQRGMKKEAQNEFKTVLALHPPNAEQLQERFEEQIKND